MRATAGLIAVVTWCALATPPARAATPAEVEQALAKAKAYLYSQQSGGNWEKVPKRDDDKSKPGNDTSGSQWGGLTAISVLALLVGGEDPQNEKLVKPIEFLKKADVVGTYVLGVRCQIWLMIPQTPEVKNLMRADMRKLMGMMKTQDYARGFYDYDATGGPKTHSLSRSQYAVLGMWAAAQSGQEVSSAYWSETEKAWVRAQRKDGGWAYYVHKDDPPVTAGITAVGVATLFIVQDQLYGSRNVNCTTPVEIPAIEKGIDWMTKNFDKVANETPYPRDFPFATLYAVERVGVAGGLKYFGKHDWYKIGADYLIKQQAKNGSIGKGFPGDVANTCFSVIFLSRGRAPVVFNKLDWAADDKAAAGNWNRRPRDLANVTRWIGRSFERELNWQIVDLESPIADWHDAPILYLSGSDPMKIAAAHQGKMRQYVQDGGLILVHADCGRGGFVQTAKKLAAELFPSYEFRELPDSHPIYSTVYPRSKWKNKPSVLGVSNGVRELMLLIPQADPGKTWQIGAVIPGREEHWQLAANITFYAADQRDLKYKGETHVVAEDPGAKPGASLKLARLKYAGNWDPEPGGWRRLRNLLRRSGELDVEINTVALGSGSLDGVKVAHLTGTTKIKLDDAAKAQIKKFVAAGGTLVIDAAGGSEGFASSIEPELETLAAGGKVETLPPEHPIFGGAKVSYRPYAQQKLVGKANAPRVQAIVVDKRPAVIFSREDLSVGLVGHSVGGIIGYTPAAATDIVRRIVLTAAGVTPASPVAAGEKSSSPKKSEPSSPKTDGDGLD